MANFDAIKKSEKEYLNRFLNSLEKSKRDNQSFIELLHTATGWENCNTTEHIINALNHYLMKNEKE